MLDSQDALDKYVHISNRTYIFGMHLSRILQNTAFSNRHCCPFTKLNLSAEMCDQNASWKVNRHCSIVPNTWDYIIRCGLQNSIYHQTSNIRHTKSKNLNVSRLVLHLAQSIKPRCWVENEDVVGAAPPGDAPATSG